MSTVRDVAPNFPVAADRTGGQEVADHMVFSVHFDAKRLPGSETSMSLSLLLAIAGPAVQPIGLVATSISAFDQTY
jgi:hypothetical protein